MTREDMEIKITLGHISGVAYEINLKTAITVKLTVSKKNISVRIYKSEHPECYTVSFSSPYAAKSLGDVYKRLLTVLRSNVCRANA